ncbi:hypothetical protein NP493_186g01004 [Ridgeia piscesae]|uniref:Uncharacterized protein n=1 Tax=Ridgeia piscesae TaxID=27915 RepID=A0AAD9UEU7_RIDPI|nr:hypothetical protein NP493_186g01004 [Ridgeia piscesae]
MSQCTLPTMFLPPKVPKICEANLGLQADLDSWRRPAGSVMQPC